MQNKSVTTQHRPCPTMTCCGSVSLNCVNGQHFMTCFGPATAPARLTSSLISIRWRAFVWKRAGARSFAGAVSVTPFIR